MFSTKTSEVEALRKIQKLHPISQSGNVQKAHWKWCVHWKLLVFVYVCCEFIVIWSVFGIVTVLAKSFSQSKCHHVLYILFAVLQFRPSNFLISFPLCIFLRVSSLRPPPPPIPLIVNFLKLFYPGNFYSKPPFY